VNIGQIFALTTSPFPSVFTIPVSSVVRRC